MKSKFVFRVLFSFVVCSFAQAEIRNTLITPRGKALIILSSQAQLGSSEHKTGVWLPDATHPYFALLNAGFETDFASPKGGAVPIELRSDPRNMNAMNADDAITLGFVSNPRTLEKLNNTLKLSDVQAKNYSTVIFVGGLAAMYDLPNDPDLPRLFKEFWTQNKIVGAIGYGTYALLKMKTPSGRDLIRGAEMSAISKEEEQKMAQLMGWDVALLAPKGFLQDLIKKEGAGYKSGPAFTSFVHEGVQKHFISAQQSFSGMELGLRVAKLLTGKPLKPVVPKTEKFIKPRSASFKQPVN
ncbi:type 1 glutamine amidotransferase domain-containing protein [Bdellovibrio sp. HCB337]|uniref:type 1 glutamine amidotransferase domain-containing protein n=1 Tax=Bdellovibrio sp. HCB337 TaxID=3394358 RepID=UPI0039A71CB2